MPIYEYECQACGHRLDALQKISEPPLTDCPSCQKSALQKLVSATSFQLKGEGWYVTDFKNKKQPSTGAVESKTTGSSESTSDAKTSTSSDSTPNGPTDSAST